jgi:hypothetical protein
MVIMPGSLHIAQVACQCVPADVRLVAMLNGTDDWEDHWARAHLKGAWLLKARFMYRHHTLLNLLLREIPQPFGVIDFDCFVFRADYLRGIESIGPKTSAQVFFANYDELLDLWIPETFLLTLNQPILAELMARYRVGADQIEWDDLPGAVRQRLATLGIGRNQLPENYKSAIDTLRVLLLLAVADGYPLEMITRHSVQKYVTDDVFHIGSSSNPQINLQLNADWALWGSYFWVRRLELIEDRELRDRYRARFGIGDSESVLSRFSERPEPQILDFMDRLAAGKLPVKTESESSESVR